MKRNKAQKLKVLHIISGDLWAGAEAMALNLLRRLNNYVDLDISVVVLNYGKLSEELKREGIDVIVIDESKNSFGCILSNIHAIVRETNPNIIHSHRNKENLLAFLASRTAKGTKLITTLHGLPEFVKCSPNLTQQLKLKLNSYIISRYFCTVAVSENIRSVLIDCFGFSRNKLKVIHNGIELPDPKPLQAKSDRFVIGSSGRLFPVKDYPLMIEIARLISEKLNTKIRFELAGDGPERSSLQGLIHDYGLESDFFLLGHQDDMSSFYKGIDLYLNTSIHEGIPMTILEALAHGIPVVAPAVGGIPEIITHGEDGFLIDSRDPNDFAEKCIYCNENRPTYSLMAKSAREKIEQSFSATSMAASYHQLYFSNQA